MVTDLGHLSTVYRPNRSVRYQSASYWSEYGLSYCAYARRPPLWYENTEKPSKLIILDVFCSKWSRCVRNTNHMVCGHIGRSSTSPFLSIELAHASLGALVGPHGIQNKARDYRGVIQDDFDRFGPFIDRLSTEPPP